MSFLKGLMVCILLAGMVSAGILWACIEVVTDDDDETEYDDDGWYY